MGVLSVGAGGGVKGHYVAAGDGLGDKATTSTSWATIAGVTVDVPVVEGDVLLCILEAEWVNTGSAAGGLNVAVDGNNIAPATRGWYCGDTENVVFTTVGVTTHEVQAGDITAGETTVTGKFRRQGALGTFTVKNDGEYGVPTLTVINLGHV